MSVSISGILLDPYGQPARFAEVKFITWQGAADVLTTAPAVFKTSADGTYAFDVEFGTFTVQVRYNQSNGKFQTIKQKVIVNGDVTATTLGELLEFNTPLTPPEIAYVEQLVAEAEGYRDESETFSIAASGYADDSEQSAIQAANSVAAIAPVSLGDGIWGTDKTYTAYNQYLIYSGQAYSPLPTTTLPYPCTAAPDLAFVYPINLNDHRKLSNRNAADAHDGIYSRNFKNIADLNAGIDATGQSIDMSSIVGSRVFWRGYYVEADGGSNWGIVRSGPYTADGGSIFSIDENTYVEANLKGGRTSVKKFGATGRDGVVEYGRIQACADWVGSNGGGEVHFPTPNNNDDYDIGNNTILTRHNAVSFTGVNDRACKITTTNITAIGNDGTDVRSYINISHLFFSVDSDTDGARVVDYTYWNHFEINKTIVEFAGNGGSGIYGVGTSAGSSPFYGKMNQNNIAVLGTATNANGYWFAAYTSPAGDFLRGPNSIRVSGGRVANCLRSVFMEAGNNNRVSVDSEAVDAGGYDIVLGKASASQSGSVTSATSSSVVDSSANFGNALVNGSVHIVSGTGAGQFRKIDGRSATSLSLKNPWMVIPDATSTYEVFPVDAVNNTFEDCRSEGTTSKAGFLRRHGGSYQNTVANGNIASLGSGVLINEDAFEFADLNQFAGIKEVENYTFYLDNVASSISGSDMNAAGSSKFYVLPYDGEIVGVSIYSSIAINGGSLTVEPSINGSSSTVSLNAVLQASGGRDRDNIQVATWGSNPMGGRNRSLGCKVTTTGDFSPSTTDILVTVYLMPRN